MQDNLTIVAGIFIGIALLQVNSVFPVMNHVEEQQINSLHGGGSCMWDLEILRNIMVVGFNEGKDLIFICRDAFSFFLVPFQLSAVQN